MMKILRVEYAKLKHFNLLKIIFLCYMVILPSWMWFMDYFFKNEPKLRGIFTKADLFKFPEVWSFTTYSASFFNILLGVIIVVATCNEIQYKTMRQNVIDGLTKKQVILGKFLFVCFLSVSATLYTFLCASVIGISTNGTSLYGENIHLILLYFIQTLGYFSFAFFFALVVKRPAVAIITFIFYFPLETIIGNIINRNMYQFFPLKIFADLTPNPFFKELLAMRSKEEGVDIWVIDSSLQIYLALFYALLLFFVSYWMIRRRDL